MTEEQYNAAALRQALVSIRKHVHAPGAKILTAIMRLEGAWDQLGTCADEFEPEDMTACAEYRGLLDDAILGVLECVRS